MSAVDIIKLADANRNFFEVQSLDLQERAHLLTGFLTAHGVLPVKRAVLNGATHNLFSAMLVLIENGHNGEFTVGTRNNNELTKSALSSGLIDWINAAVKMGLIAEVNGAYHLQLHPVFSGEFAI